MGADDLCLNCSVSFPALITGSLRLRHRTIVSSINTPDSLYGLGPVRMSTTPYLGPASGRQAWAVSPGPLPEAGVNPQACCSRVLADTASEEQESSEANFLVPDPVYLPERQKPGWESHPHH